MMADRHARRREGGEGERARSGSVAHTLFRMAKAGLVPLLVVSSGCVGVSEAATPPDSTTARGTQHGKPAKGSGGRGPPPHMRLADVAGEVNEKQQQLRRLTDDVSSCPTISFNCGGTPGSGQCGTSYVIECDDYEYQGWNVSSWPVFYSSTCSMYLHKSTGDYGYEYWSIHHDAPYEPGMGTALLLESVFYSESSLDYPTLSNYWYPVGVGGGTTQSYQAATCVVDPTPSPTPAPSITSSPTLDPTLYPTPSPTNVPTMTDMPSAVPSTSHPPTEVPSPLPTSSAPSPSPTSLPTPVPTPLPSVIETYQLEKKSAAATAYDFNTKKVVPKKVPEQMYEKAFNLLKLNEL